MTKAEFSAAVGKMRLCASGDVATVMVKDWPAKDGRAAYRSDGDHVRDALEQALDEVRLQIARIAARRQRGA